MPDTLDFNGLRTKTVAEIINDLINGLPDGTPGLKQIYGDDINVDQNSPDGQWINILAQVLVDHRELLQDIYGSFNPDSAYGVTLDQRVALNGISRKVGTYTVAYVIITSDRAQTLPGLDQTALPAYKVSDEAGNQFQLVASHTFSAAGSASLAFRAVNIGQVLTTPNTITNQITTTLGVTAVNNPDTSGDVPGTDEETDAQLKARRGKSFSLAATGPADAIRAAILDMDDVSDAAVIENDTGDPVNGVPAHSIWCIVTGGTEADIAQAIYSKKAPGCGMKGSVTHDITRPQGNTFTAQWDVSSTQALYIQFAIVPRVAGLTFNNDAIKASLAAAMVYKLLQNPSIGDVVMAMQTIEPNAIVTSVAVSVDGDDWQQVVTPDSADKYFTVAVGDISIS